MIEQSVYFNDQSELEMVNAIVASEGAVLDELDVMEDHFFHFANRAIFEAQRMLWKAGKKVQWETLHPVIDRTVMEQIGGPGSLAAMLSTFPTATASDILHELELQRAKRTLQNALNGSINRLNDCRDIEAFCSQLSGAIRELEPQKSGDNLLPSLIQTINAKLDRMDRGEMVFGFKTGIEPWNKAFGGIVNGQLYAIAARPAMGKTAMMEMMIAELIANMEPILVFERDMSPQKLIERIACRESKISYRKFIRNHMTPDERDYLRSMISSIGECPLIVHNPQGLTADKLCSTVRREVRRSGVKAVFIDTIQTLDTGRDMREGLTQASKAIRRTVTETDVPHVVLCHLNREGDTGRPSASNIKEFDQLFGDADGIVILWSEQKQADIAPGEMRTIKFYVAKNRDGAEGEDELLFNGDLMKFLPKLRG